MFKVNCRTSSVRVLDVKVAAPIDQYDSQSFNINECGFIRNDISQLARAQTQAEFDAIMRKVGTINPSFNVKDGMTVRQAFDSIRPRQLQTPAELAGFAEYMASQESVYSDVKVPVSVDSVNSEEPAPASE